MKEKEQAKKRHTKITCAGCERMAARITDLEREVERLKHELDTVRTHASRDTLTGMFNRGELEEHAQYFVHAVNGNIKSDARKKSGKDVSFCFLDMNHLKTINDIYGHDAGDRAIKLLGQVISDNIRKTDIAGRAGSGADEFGIIFPNTSIENAQAVVEKIKRALKHVRLDVEGKSIPITASFGVASTGEGFIARSELFHAADTRMYADKRRQRQRRKVG